MIFLTSSPSNSEVDIRNLFDQLNPNEVTKLGLVDVVKMQPDVHYLLSESVAGKYDLLKKIIAIHKGDDLIIFHIDGSKIIFVDYYLSCSPNNNSEEVIENTCSVTVMGEDGAKHTFKTPAPASGEHKLSDTASIVYIQGDHYLVGKMLGMDGDLDDAISDFSNSDSLPVPLFGIASSLLGGGISNKSSAISDGTESELESVAKVYSLTVILGPLIDEGVGTTVILYTSDGTLLGNMSYELASNRYTFTDSTGYSGVVVAHLQDTDPEADYRDETTGLMEDITSDLYVAAVITSAERTVNLYMTPLSTISSQKLGVIYDGSKVTIDSNVVNVENTNKAVAQAFGLGSDIDLSRSPVISTISSDGVTKSDANAYGKALAILSAAEQASPEATLATVIESVLNNLTVIGATGTLTPALKAALIVSAPDAGVGEGEASRLLGGVNADNIAPTGSVVIEGIFAQGQTLRAETDLYDADGLGVFSYQWQANSINILGATADALVLTENQVGKTITLEVSYTDRNGVFEIVESVASIPVANTEVPTVLTLTAGDALVEDTTATGAVVATFSATDSDAGETPVVAFTEATNDAGLYAIEGNTIVLTANGKVALDEDNTMPDVSLTVSGTANPVIKTLTLAVTAAEDATVLVLIARAALVEGTALVGAVVARFRALDSDAGETPVVVFTPATNDAGYYAIVENTVTLTSAGKVALDADTIMPVISLTTSGTFEDVTRTVTPTTTLVNDDLVLTMGTVATFTEDSTTAGDPVVSVTSASDEDGGAITYIVSDTANYVIDPNTGAVTLTATGAAFVNAGNNLPAFTVTATSAGDDSSSTSNTLTPTATTLVNDALALTMGTVATFTEDSTTAGDPVVSVTSASDEDGGDITYTVSDTANYAIDPNTGAVTLTITGAALVNAGNNLPAFTVTATSAGDDSSSTSNTVTPPTITAAPTVTITSISNNDVVGSNDISMTNIMGTTTGIENGQNISIRTLGQTANSTVNNNVWSIDNLDLSRFSVRSNIAPVATLTTNITSWLSGGTQTNLDEIVDGNKSTVDDGNNDYAIHPLGANGQNITFTLDGVFNNGSFEFYNRTSGSVSDNSRINGSTVEFKLAGITQETHTITGAGNEVTLTPAESVEFDQVVLTFSGDDQNFREIEILGELIRADLTATVSDQAGDEATASLTATVDLVDTLAPTISGAISDNTTVTVTIGEDLNELSVPDLSAFEIAGNTIDSVTISGQEIVLTVSSAITDTVVLSYAKPATGNVLEDIAGNDFASLSEISIGTSGVDTIVGTADNDFIIGNASIDTLTGNGGSNTFDYNSISDGNDVITDFTIGTGAGADTLDLRDLLNYTATDTLANFVQFDDAGSGGDVEVKIDVDGSNNFAAADLTLTLSNIGTGSLVLSDFENNLIVL